jgi:cytosine/adenosine deaminase-related metal-dependent hydrolase
VLIGGAGELRALEYAQRLVLRERNVLADAPGASTGGRLYRAAYSGGNAALGAAAQGLAVGAPADLISLNDQNPAFIGRRGDAVLDSWIFAARGQAIDCVWRAGEKWVEQGRHRQAETIGAAYRQTLTRLLSL